MGYRRRELSQDEADNIIVILELIGYIATFGKRTRDEDSVIYHYSYNDKFYEVKRHYNVNIVPTVTEIIIEDN